MQITKLKRVTGPKLGKVQREHLENLYYPPLSDTLKTSTCPACGYHVAVPFFYGEKQPLATIAWPASAKKAKAMEKLPLDFVRCVDCGHVYNSSFEYAKVPYSEKPNLMFNKGKLWKDHLQYVAAKIAEFLPENPTVVEIGCGEGHLLRAIAKLTKRGKFVGFDPNSGVNTGNGTIEFIKELFDPRVHLSAYKPDLIISRHVLEHLIDPLSFIQSLMFGAAWEDMSVNLFIEVPCIDRVFESGRVTDFFYEHNSHFTTDSLTRMAERCANKIMHIERAYNNEVIFAVTRFEPDPRKRKYYKEAIEFNWKSKSQKCQIKKELEGFAKLGRKVAIWGGTGKSAAFINYFDLDLASYPVVVDSDQDKTGTFVPGSGQEIRPSEYLLEKPADIILITTQWRAKDIVLEIKEKGIHFESILLEHNGRLVDYFSGQHPYK